MQAKKNKKTCDQPKTVQESIRNKIINIEGHIKKKKKSNAQKNKNTQQPNGVP